MVLQAEPIRLESSRMDICSRNAQHLMTFNVARLSLLNSLGRK